MDTSRSEDDSALYRKLVEIAVPRREAQIATLLTLAPMMRDEACSVPSIASGSKQVTRYMEATFPGSEDTGPGSTTPRR